MVVRVHVHAIAKNAAQEGVFKTVLLNHVASVSGCGDHITTFMVAQQVQTGLYIPYGHVLLARS